MGTSVQDPHVLRKSERAQNEENGRCNLHQSAVLFSPRYKFDLGMSSVSDQLSCDCIVGLDKNERVSRLYHVVQTCDTRSPSLQKKEVEILHSR